jgi:probable dihydroxyacetone kinase regulator
MKTKELIELTLIKNLSKTTLDNISVKSICEECNISRQTFYYHFCDIYQVLEVIFKEQTAIVVGENKNYESWTQGFRNVLDLMLKYKPFVFNTYRSISKEYLENFLYQVIDDLLLSILNEKGVNYPYVKKEEKQFIARFYRYAFAGVILDWVKNNMRQDPKTTIYYFSTIIENDFIDALNSFNLQNKG